MKYMFFDDASVLWLSPAEAMRKGRKMDLNPPSFLIGWKLEVGKPLSLPCFSHAMCFCGRTEEWFGDPTFSFSVLMDGIK